DTVVTQAQVAVGDARRLRRMPANPATPYPEATKPVWETVWVRRRSSPRRTRERKRTAPGGLRSRVYFRQPIRWPGNGVSFAFLRRSTSRGHLHRPEPSAPVGW